MSVLIDNIRKALSENADEKIRAGSIRFFKETIKCYGIKSAVVSKIAKETYQSVKEKSKAEIFQLCEELWQSGYMEESFIACNWSYYVHKKYEPDDIKLFERWINNYISNWASCDTFCNHTVGEFLEMFPEYINSLKKWAKSENRWMRRASAVSLILPARHGKFLNEIFEIADILLLDKDDLVQKAYGWMLKVASQTYQKEVFDFVVQRKSKMRRTALRYAIEKMPKAMKSSAMEK